MKKGLLVAMATRRIKQDGGERGMLIYGYTKCASRKFRPVKR
ncbi:MAG TPA: hypothetical protein VMW28_07965 [Pelolinea sp.]|nr:hypothetical protein [Pelolinea sp.]